MFNPQLFSEEKLQRGENCYFKRKLIYVINKAFQASYGSLIMVKISMRIPRNHLKEQRKLEIVNGNETQNQ